MLTSSMSIEMKYLHTTLVKTLVKREEVELSIKMVNSILYT